jgi:hypothetical protein
LENVESHWRFHFLEKIPKVMGLHLLVRNRFTSSLDVYKPEDSEDSRDEEFALVLLVEAVFGAVCDDTGQKILDYGKERVPVMFLKVTPYLFLLNRFEKLDEGP